MDVRVFTVRVAELPGEVPLEIPFRAALIVVVPAPTLVASPDALMVATAVLEEAHVTRLVSSTLLPPE